jgi:thiamine-phosphate pyrophosphorylase
MMCLVTDRRRLAGAAVPPLAAVRRCLAAQARFAAEAGVDLLQVRESDLSAADLAWIVRDIIAATRGTPTRVVVNDRADVAIACGAAGVHLRADSAGVAAVRRLAPRGFVVGRSVHSIEAALAANDADYLIAGTVFASVSKPGRTDMLGVDGLTAIVRSVPIPVLAIGGVAESNVDEIGRTGAAGFAAIGAFIRHAGAPPDSCGAAPLDAIVRRMRRSFDSVKTAS